MKTDPTWITDQRREALKALCDTVVPSINRAEDPHGFWARSGSDLGADQGIIGALDTMPDEQRDALLGLIDVLDAHGLVTASQQSREDLLTATAQSGPAAATGVGVLTKLILMYSYGLTDHATGRNPMWEQFGYPGPAVQRPTGTKTIVPVIPDGDTELTADVVVVGSGAGGGVIAARLAQAGQRVVVLEAGGYFDEEDFDQIELHAYRNSFWRGGPTPTADMNLTLQAGAGLGGGTTINWTNCLRTRPWVRQEWAQDHGLDGVDGVEFDRHLDAVSARMSVNDKCSDFNGPNQRLRDAAAKLGWAFTRLARNTDEASYSPDTSGYLGFGDPTGSKQGTMKTYLQDAFDAGAQILVRTAAQQILLDDDGCAAGVAATYTDPNGAVATVTVHAPRVVVACGALEAPALLLRSGIGGPAVGKNLRLHPVIAAISTFAEDQQAWWGACMTACIEQFEHPEHGYGFLIQAPQFTTASASAFIPYTSGIDHKTVMGGLSKISWAIAIMRDHGSGEVTIDEDGRAAVTYSVTDPIDVANLRAGVDAMVRAHHAAGAEQIFVLADGLPSWQQGEDVDTFIANAQSLRFGAGGYRMFSAHQMGSCRMGVDPQTSVADPNGQLHDTPGVWIGDGSAFPTSSGTNPMLSIMALADRTADKIITDITTSHDAKRRSFPVLG
ncbi:MAG: GMC family oxidoreductase [Actinomycetia bacterium]|nr:GMC family oxidoreductase [Actinomycetes bacterium]MCH9702471.1 GMC family oxidoreductase [Actinomycetes bacterium]MCH9760225.1 GMC family oxidoreductase [Actinomycetes bacterium]